jgi:hypothetical protein
MSIRSSGTVVLAAAVIAVSVLGSAAGGSAASSSRHPSAAETANQEAAIADASNLLGRLQLPPGSTFSQAKPAGTSAVLDEPLHNPYQPRTLVLRRSWWIVPGDQKAALRWIEAHPPANAKLTPAEFTGGPEPVGKSRADVAEFTWNPVPDQLFRRSLTVLLANRADGSTILRADAAVEWTVPHSPEERIPSAARVLDVKVRSESVEKVTKKAITIARPQAVHRIAGLMNDLPVLQPAGITPCGVEFGGTFTTIRLTFRASRHGHPLAEAVQELPTCPPPVIFLKIRGREQTPLIRDGAVLRSVKAMLGGRQGGTSG